MKPLNSKKIFYGRIADLVFKAIFFPLSIFKQKHPDIKKEKFQNILLLEFHKIGDLVTATSSFQALRRKYLKSRIVLLASPFAKQLLKNNNVFNGIILFKCPWSTYDWSVKNLKNLFSLILKLRKQKWHLAIDLRGDFRDILFMYLIGAKRRLSYDTTGGNYLLTDVVPFNRELKHIIKENLNVVSYLGCDISEKEPKLKVNKKNKDFVNNYLEKRFISSDDLVVGIFPGAGHPKKLWRNERFAKIAERLISNYRMKVILFCGPEDDKIIEGIKKHMKFNLIVIKTDLEKLPAFIKRCYLFIGLDSGPSHIASAVDIPIVVLFGPQKPDFTKPYAKNCEVVIKQKFRCRPCSYNECPLKKSCMDAIKIEDVMIVVEKILKDNIRVQ